jgi:hypothetical protein
MANSYQTRGLAAPHNHQVYDSFLNQLGLKTDDYTHLSGRGLTSEQIKICGYSTKRANKSNETLQAINHINSHYDINGVPGFFVNENGHRTCSGISGILIPVRDCEGNIHSLLCRNSKPKNKNGLILNKYIYFSSAGKTEGNRVKSSLHCPIVKGNPKEVCGTKAILTEGVLKADVTTALGEYYCFGNNGLALSSDFEYVMDEMEIDTLYLAFDMGEDDHDDYLIKLSENIIRIQSIGIDYQLLRWNPELGKGIDDVLKNGNWDKVYYSSQDEIDSLMANADRVSPRGRDWVYCIETKTFINTENWRILDKSQYSDKFNLDGIQAVNDLLMNNYPKIDDICYEPNSEKFVERNGESYLNIWKDPKIKPIEGDITVLLDHLEYLFPNEDDREIFTDYLAYNIIHPEEKVLWALLIVGKQGIGKSFFGQLLDCCLGEDNVVKPTNEQLNENYTGWMKQGSIAVIEEVFQRDKFDFMNKMKPIITQPTIRIREMRRESYPIPNIINFLMFTNRDVSITLENDDRRYAILKSPAKQREKEYYQKLFKWLEEPETAGKIINYFKNYDLSKFEPKANAPTTEAKHELIQLSRSGLEEWISENIEDESWPFNNDLVSIKHLKNREVCPNGYEKWSNQKWAEALKNCGAERLDCYPKLSDGSRVKLWAVRRKEMWASQSSSDEGNRVMLRYYESASLEQAPDSNPILETKPI